MAKKKEIKMDIPPIPPAPEKPKEEWEPDVASAAEFHARMNAIIKEFEGRGCMINFQVVNPNIAINVFKKKEIKKDGN